MKTKRERERKKKAGERECVRKKQTLKHTQGAEQRSKGAETSVNWSRKREKREGKR